jgi:sodium-coupled neutral amino acid transporter 11
MQPLFAVCCPLNAVSSTTNTSQDHNSLLIYGSLKKPTLDRFATVTHYSTAVSLCMCVAMGVAGFLSFGSKTQGNVLNNFPSDNIMVNIARL